MVPTLLLSYVGVIAKGVIGGGQKSKDICIIDKLSGRNDLAITPVSISLKCWLGNAKVGEQN